MRLPPAKRVVLVTMGSRGDIQPLCILGRELVERGVSVKFVANSDYSNLVASFGLELVAVSDAPFGAAFQTEEFGHLFDQYAKNPKRRLSQIFSYKRRLEEHITDVMLTCLREISEADVVVYNPLAFFVGELARELGIPSVRVSSQPLLPSRMTSFSIFGGRELGAIGNRLSYEALRLASLILFRAVFKAFRRASGLGMAFRASTNPLTISMQSSRQVLAFSPTLSPDPGDWPVPVTHTGFWFDEPRGNDGLPAHIDAFLNAGPPPVYVGFGSMVQGAPRVTALILDALTRWGGRAILARGAGGLSPPDSLPPNWLGIGAASHALLLPRCAAAVHHGGSGTTGAVLKAGLPAVVCPVLGDQLYWGRRVAAVGAAEEPIALGRITPDQLAGRIGRVLEKTGFRTSALSMAAAMAEEPGVAAAADLVIDLAEARAGASRAIMS